MKRWIIFLIAFAIACAVPILQRKAPAPQTIEGPSMGTTWHLQAIDAENYRDLIQAGLDQQEAHFSTWRNDSDLMRYNLGIDESPTQALAQLISIAQKLERETQGAFSPALLQASIESGFTPPPSQPLTRHYDLSGIAKGHAVDQIVSKLRSAGLNDFVFELGGELFASGHAPDGSAWKVTIESLDRSNVRLINLTNEALATSGNQHQISKVAPDGTLTSHLIDPNTNKPRERPLSSVSVIAPTCTEADAWATALFILGPQAQCPHEVIWKTSK